MEPKKENEMLGVRFSPEVTLGHVLQGVIAAAGVASVIFVFAGRVNRTADQFDDFKSTVVASITELKTSTKEQVTTLSTSMKQEVANLRLDIANIPDIRAGLSQMQRQLDQLDKRQDQTDARAGAQSDRMGKLESEQMQTRATLDSTMQVREQHQGAH
jgi:uncharacterized protein (DUF3084 family)